MSQVVLRLSAISKSFDAVPALQNVSFELLAGEIHALVGENGAGKSTLIKLITGAHQPDEGIMEIAGQRIVHNNPIRSRQLGVAPIYQQPALFPDLTVAENIALGLEPSGAWRRIRWTQRRQRARKLLRRLEAEIDPDSVVQRLSMPQQQIVEIARALGAHARVLILDEPTASLSEREVRRLLQQVRRLRDEGVGILYVSHRLEELLEFADRVTVLRDGVAVGTCPMNQIDRDSLIRLMVGREVSTIYPKTPAAPGQSILQLIDVGCSESGVSGVTLTVHAGEIVGLAGLVGAGRTELACILFGLTPADAGEIRLHGQPVTIDSPARAVDSGIAYVPEDRRRHGVILELPVAANTTLAVLERVSRWGRLDFARERRLAQSFVERLKIKTASVAAPVEQLSGGNQQKVAVARWLATEPAVLILDEPTQGVDIGAKAEIHRLMNELTQRGLAILMISSELPEILGMSDRICVMRGGRVVGTLDRSDATPETVLALALGKEQATPSGDRCPETA